MVAIVSGLGAGLELGSRAVIGSWGMTGQPQEGRNGQSVHVNVATGNLVVQNQDDYLTARGLDHAVLRTYNSAGGFDGDNGDHWRAGNEMLRLHGTLHAAGSTMERTTRDGGQEFYVYDAARALYVSTAGAGAYDTVTYVQVDGQFEWRDGSTGVTQRFEGSGEGRLLSSRDPGGNVLAYTYDANGLLASVVAPNGDASFYDYEGTLLTQVRVASAGVTTSCTRYAYDSANRLQTVTVDLTPGDNSIVDGVTYQTHYGYEGASTRIAFIAQSDGSSLAITYTDLGGGDYRVASIRNALGALTSFSYGAGFATVTDPLFQVTRYEFDAQGQLTRVVTPGASGVALERLFTYSGTGDVLSMTDGVGNTTHYAYDAHGNQVSQRNALGNTVRRTYDAGDRLLAETVYVEPDPDGAGAATPGVPQTERRIYDTEGRSLLRFIVRPDGGVTEHRYNGFGERTETLVYAAERFAIQALAPEDTIELSALEAWTATQDPDTRQRTVMSYDARGQLQSRTTYAGQESAVEHFVHDQAGRLLQILAADGAATHYSYDGLGRLLVRTDALGQIETTVYDDAGRRTITTLVGGLVRTQAYDAAGRLTSSIESATSGAPLGETRYFHDDAGQLRMVRDPGGTWTSFFYDEAGRKVADVDGNGTLTEYGYDRAGRLVRTIRYATPADLSLLVSPSGVPMMHATLAGIRPSSHADDQVSWRAYDAAGRLAREATPVGSGDSLAVVENRYDGAGRLLQVVRYATTVAAGSVAAGSIPAPPSSAEDRVTRYFHDATGLVAAMLDAEGYLTVFRYTAAGQLGERVIHATPVESALRLTGALSQLLPAASLADRHEFTLYDGTGRVHAHVDAERYLTETIYDAAGNVAQVIRYATRVPGSVAADTPIALLRPPASAADQTSIRSYDALHRLVQETDERGVQTRYEYDAEGRLVSTTRAAGSEEARTLLARHDLQGRLVGELSAEGAALLTGDQTAEEIAAIWSQHGVRHTYDAAGRRLSTIDALGRRTLFFYDADGAVTHTVNAFGEVEETRRDTFGRVIERIVYAGRIAPAAFEGGLVSDALKAAVAAIANPAADSRIISTYTRDNHLASSLDAAGLRTTWGYNAFGDAVNTRRQGIGVDEVETYVIERRGLQVQAATDAAGVHAVTNAVYDAFGQITRTVSANGQVREQTFDRLGRVVVSRDPLNAQRSSSYDAFGRVLTQTDALGNVTTYAYDTAARAMSVTTPEGIVTRTTYDRHGQVHTMRDGDGNVTIYRYDRAGRLAQTATALTSSTRGYDAAGQLVETTDANGTRVVYSYDAAGRVLTRCVDPDGLDLVTLYVHDAKGQRVSVTDANGVTTATEYDRGGRVLRQIVDPAGLHLSTVYAYDARGNVLTVQSPAGTVTEYAYDGLGRRILERVDPDGLDLRRTCTYDVTGNVVASSDARGGITRYAYDLAGRLVFAVDPLGAVQHNVYDAQGRIVRTTAYAAAIQLGGLSAEPAPADIASRIVTDPTHDRVEHRVLDADGRLVATIDGLGAVVRYTHDAGGNVTDRVAYANRADLSGWTVGTLPAVLPDASRDARTSTVYDGLGRAIYTVDGTGAATAYTYDGEGRVLTKTAFARVLPPDTPRTAEALQAALTALAQPGKDHRLRYAYDSAGRLAGSVDGTGAVVQWVRDGNGNVLREIRYATVLAAGAMPGDAVSTAADRITAFAYDTANRLVLQVNAVGAVTERTLDAEGHLLREVAYAQSLPQLPPAGASAAAIRAQLVPDPQEDRTRWFGYDAAGRQVLAVGPEGAVIEQHLDAQGQVVARTAYATLLDTALLASVASLADMRALLTASQADRVNRFVYDASGRPTFEIDALGGVSRYTYDALGSLLEVRKLTRPVALPAAPQPVQLNVALLSGPDDRVETHAYDAAGNRVSTRDGLGATESWTYDALGLRTSFTNKKGAVWTYEHDAAGRTVREDSPVVTLVTTYPDGTGQQILAAPSQDAKVTTLLAYDGVGNLLRRTEAAGRPEERTTQYEYDAAGQQVRVVFPTVRVYDPTLDNLTASTGATRAEVASAPEVRTFYNAFGDAVANVNVVGGFSQKVYDGSGRVLYDIDAAGFVTGYAYNVFGEATQLTRFASTTSLAERQVHAAGQAASKSEVEIALAAGTQQAANRSLRTVYDRAGRVVETRQPQAFVFDATLDVQHFWAEARTRHTYNAFGERVETASARDHTGVQWFATTHYFDALGRETATVDAMGYLTLRLYDRFGNLAEVREYAQALAPHGWTRSSYGTPVASADDRVIRYAHDLLDRKVVETRVQAEYSAASNGTSTRGDLTTRFAYDALANQTMVTDALGQSTWTYYDALGRVRAVAAPFGTAGTKTLTLFQRDAHGNVVVKIEHATPVAMTGADYAAPVASAADRSTLTQFDALGRAIAVQDANAAVAFTSFDLAGNVAKTWRTVTGSDGVARTQFQRNLYDVLGRLTATLTPASTMVLQGGISADYKPGASLSMGEDRKNKLTLAWSTLVDTAAGDVRVSVDYLTKARLVVNGEDSRLVPASVDTSTVQYGAAQASGGATLIWDTPTDAVLHIRVMQLQGGQWKVLWEGPLSKAQGSGMATVNQAAAGLVHTRQTFNAFGEITSRETGGGGEYFEYDMAGRLWRTNSGDGADKIFLYDLQGNVTSEIRSEGSGGTNRDIRTMGSAEVAQADPNTRRVDMRYNALGHLVSRTESRRSRTDGSVSLTQQFLTATIHESGQATGAQGNVVLPRYNEVRLSWSDLRALGPGDLTVRIEYTTPLTQHGGYLDEFGQVVPITYTGGVLRSYETSLLVGDANATGVVLRWQEMSNDPDASGVALVVRVRLMKKDGDGILRSLFDQAPGYGPNEIRIAAPADSQTKIQLMVRRSGATTWTQAPGLLADFGDSFRYDATALGVGVHEYRVEALRPGETAFTPIASGAVQLSMPALASITTPITFGQAYRDGAYRKYVPGAMAWAHQDRAVQQVLRYRPAGSTQAWLTLPIEVFNEGQRDGVDITGLASGTYEFELLWNAPGQGVPTSHATGTFKVIPPKPSQWVPPVGVPKINGAMLGTMWVPGGGTSEVDDVRPVPALIWTASNADTVRYMRNGQWVNLAIDNQYAHTSSPESGTAIQRASLASLGVGTHTIEIRRTAGSSLLTVLRYVVSANGTRTLTDITPPYTPGYWTAAVPTAYSVTVSTAAGSGAISTTDGVRLTPLAQQGSGQQWLRPVVQQNTDRWGNVVAITDPRSVNWVTTYRFNWNNQMVGQTLPGAAGSPSTQIYFDALGRQVAVRDANGHVNGQVFDAAGNLLEERHADGGIVRHTYDALGRRQSTVDAMGNMVTFGYDAMGNRLWLDKGALYVYEYDGSQNVSTTVRHVVERWTYDQLGQRLTHTNGNGETLTYLYDLRGNVVETKQPLGQKTRSAYDALGRKIAEVDANAVAATWLYDYFGRLMGHTDLGGARYTYTYDNAAQLVRQTNTRNQNLTYQYDRAGQLTGIVDAALGQATTYMYDEAGRRIRERVVQQGITYQDNHLAYDAAGNLRDVADARVHVSIQYDGVGNRTKVQTQVGYVGLGGSPESRSMPRYFLYDAMNRQIAAEAVDASGNIDASGGHIITYDKNGNRTSDTSFRRTTMAAGGASMIAGYRLDGSAIQAGSSSTFQTGIQRSTETYRYDAANRIRSVERDGVQVEHRHYDGADRLVHSGPVELPQGYLAAARTGLAAGQPDGLDRTFNRYDANGRLLRQLVLEGNGGDRADVSWNPNTTYGGLTPDGYDGVGNSKGYVVWDKDSNTFAEYTTSFARFEGHQAEVISGRSSVLSPGSTTHKYDANGFLIGIVDSRMGANDRTFVNDASGKALYVNQGGRVQRQLIVNGEVLGIYGVGVDPVRPRDGAGNPNFANIVDFEFGYAPITSTHPNPAPGAYVARPGDTLQSIAQGAYGDSALWYRIAEANGLTSSNDLKVGQTLNVPNRVTTIHNNESTFKPYDPSRITGDVTPNLPMPKEGCGGVGQVLMVLVTVVMSAITGGVAGAFMGSLMGQVVGLSTDAISDFSWKQMALTMVSSYVGGQLNVGASLVASETAAAMINAAVGNAITQGVAVAVGFQDKFDWRGVVASGLGAGIGRALGAQMGLPTDGVRPEGMDWGEYAGKSLAVSFVAGLSVAAARGGRIATVQVAVDAFGNALGSSLADAMGPQNSAQENFRLGEIQEQNDRARANALYGLAGGGDGMGLRVGGGSGLTYGGARAAAGPTLSFAEDTAMRKAMGDPYGWMRAGTDAPPVVGGPVEFDMGRANDQWVATDRKPVYDFGDPFQGGDVDDMFAQTVMRVTRSNGGRPATVNGVSVNSKADALMNAAAEGDISGMGTMHRDYKLIGGLLSDAMQQKAVTDLQAELQRRLGVMRSAPTPEALGAVPGVGADGVPRFDKADLIDRYSDAIRKLGLAREGAIELDYRNFEIRSIGNAKLTPSQYVTEIESRYQRAFARGVELGERGYDTNSLRYPVDMPKQLQVGLFADSVGREALVRYSNALGVPEGPGQLISLNRWSYDPSGSGLYVRPDVLIDLGPTQRHWIDGKTWFEGQSSTRQFDNFYRYTGAISGKVATPQGIITVQNFKGRR